MELLCFISKDDDKPWVPSTGKQAIEAKAQTVMTPYKIFFEENDEEVKESMAS